MRFARKPLFVAALASMALFARAHAADNFAKLYPEAAPDAPSEWVTEAVPVVLPTGHDVALHAGYMPEAPGVPFRGNLLYLQGFADSIRNHGEFFGKLNSVGYRVIAFDYPGQGGTEGSMNWLRVKDIPGLGETVYQKFARTDGPLEKTWIGWSTGGLAAYFAAADRRVDRVILLAPGIHIYPLVGKWGRVTPETLTSHAAAGLPDPHQDAPKPTAPALLPRFAASILKDSLRSQTLEISPEVSGLVLLSGKGDRYVRGRATRKTLARKAEHFEVRTYPGARHELHGEIPEISKQVTAAVLEFLN